MNKILLLLCFVLFGQLSYAQKSKEIILNDQNIISNVTGTWMVTAVHPGKTKFNMLSFEVKGPGFGSIKKIDDSGASKDVIAKIVPLNNNSIVFSDAEGNRSTFKIERMTSTELTLSDGVNTIMLMKK